MSSLSIPAHSKRLLMPLFLLLVSAAMVWFAYSKATAYDSQHGADLVNYVRASRYLATRQPLYSSFYYEGQRYVYSPALALLLEPAAHLETKQLVAAGTLVNTLLALAGSLVFVGAFSGWNERRLCLAALIGLSFVGTTETLSWGNANILIFFCFSLGTFFLAKGKEPAAGAWAAMTALLKTSMLPLCALLLFPPRTKAVTFAAAFLVAGYVLSFAAVGWDEWVPFVHATTTAAADPLHAAYLLRLGTEWSTAMTNPLLAKLPYLTLVLVVAMLTVFRLKRTGDVAAQAALIGTSLLVVTPYVTICYLMLALPLFLSAAARCNDFDEWKYALAGLVALFFATIVIDTIGTAQTMFFWSLGAWLITLILPDLKSSQA